MEGGGEGSSSSLTQLSEVSTGGTLHNVSSIGIVQFHGEVIDAVLTVAVVAWQRSGISVALQADGTLELGVQLTQRFFHGRSGGHFSLDYASQIHPPKSRQPRLRFWLE